MRAPLFARKVGRSIDLVLLLLLLLPVRALAAPTQALITGTMYKPGGAVCGGCSLTVRTPYTQSVDGGSFPGGSQSSWKTDADGELPADAYSWQGLWVEITQQYADPCTVQIPASSSVTLATLNSSCASPPLGGSNADMTAVWTCSSGDCSDLVAGGGDTFDATAADSTAPCKDGTSTPATCSVGECFFDTDATAGGNLYLCTSTDTWTLSSGGGGSGDVTAVGNCATGACFDGTSGTTLTGSGASTVLQGTGSLFFNLDTNADSSADGFVVANNSTGTGGTKLFEINESNNAYLYNNMALRFLEATANGTDAIIVSGPSSLASPFSIALPAETGTVCTTGSVCTGYAASSSDVTKVGDCASGACFDGTTGSTITAASAGHLLLKSSNSMYFDADIATGSTGNGFVFRSNNTANTLFRVIEDGYADLRSGLDLRLYDADDSNYVQFSAPSLSGNYTLALPTTDGATNDLLYNTDGSGTLGWRTPNAGTDITADLEEETHASEHSAGGADAITVTNLASACTDAQVLGGNAGGTGVECQTDDDVPEAADYSNLTAGTGITNSPTGTINATLGTAITSSEITDGEIVNADISATAAIALSKLANMSTDRLLGRDTAGSGAIEELTVGGGIEFTGSGGIQRSAFSGGDVTASAGSATLTIGADKITEAMLKVVDSPSDEECLTYESTGGDFEWQSCGSGGSGISGIAADSGGTTTGSTVTITGTGTDTTRSTDTISVDVDMTEVSLTKGSIWQGNSSNVATAYSNPSGLDVRAFGAVCDGSTDDSTAFTNCIAAVDGTDEGTCLVPATGNACIIADVTLTSNSNLVCTPGARLEAKSSVSNAMLYASSAINNVRISGCLLNLDQVEKDAIKINSGSTGITIDGNQFWWNYNSETAGTGTTAEDYIEMGCADSSSTTLGCSIRNNLIVGSNRDAQDDTGITVLDGGGILGLGSTFLIEGNIIAGTGGDCMDLTMAGIVNANLMYGCGEAGITGTFAQGVISSNEIYVNSSGGTFTIDINASNARIVGNNFPANTSGRGAARIYNGSGTQFANNYAADGVQYLTVAITNRTNHAAIKNNVFNAGNAMDDPFDGGSAVASVVVENPSDLQVVSNSFVGTAPAGGYNAIRIQNSDTATFDVAQTRILNNIISAIGAAGTDSCMLFHDASGTANNGFINMQIVANSCGVEGSTAIDNCVKVDNVAEAGNWSDVFYSANIFDDCTTWQSGASTTNVTPQVFNSAGTSFKWEPRGMNDGFQFRSIHMMGDGNCVPAAGTGYMGPISTGGNNCNATETSVDWSVGPNQVTFTNMTCRQNEDTTCTTVFTLRDDAADTSATCTTTNNDTCAWSGTVTMAASSLAAIKMSTNTSCTTESNVECDLTFTVD